ncbi:hypothetical protein WJX77_010458 [Trebouxia sp. C0004]
MRRIGKSKREPKTKNLEQEKCLAEQEKCLVEREKYQEHQDLLHLQAQIAGLHILKQVFKTPLHHQRARLSPCQTRNPPHHVPSVTSFHSQSLFQGAGEVQGQWQLDWKLGETLEAILRDPECVDAMLLALQQAHGDAVIDEAPMLIISNYHVTVFLKEVSMFKISAYGRLNLFGGINSSQLHALVGSGPCMKPLRCST